MSTDRTGSDKAMIPGRIQPQANDHWCAIGRRLLAARETVIALEHQHPLDPNAPTREVGASLSTAASGIAIRSTVVVLPDDPEEAVGYPINAAYAKPKAEAPPVPVAPATPVPAPVAEIAAPAVPTPPATEPAAQVVEMVSGTLAAPPGFEQGNLFSDSVLLACVTPKDAVAEAPGESVIPAEAATGAVSSAPAAEAMAEAPTSEPVVAEAFPAAAARDEERVVSVAVPGRSIRYAVIEPPTAESMEVPPSVLMERPEDGEDEGLSETVTPIRPRRLGWRSWFRCGFFVITAGASVAVMGGWRPWAEYGWPRTGVIPVNGLPGAMALTVEGQGAFDGVGGLLEDLEAASPQGVAATVAADPTERRFDLIARQTVLGEGSRTTAEVPTRYGYGPRRRPSAPLYRDGSSPAAPRAEALASARAGRAVPVGVPMLLAMAGPMRSELSLLQSPVEAMPEAWTDENARILAEAPTPEGGVEAFAAMAAPEKDIHGKVPTTSVTVTPPASELTPLPAPPALGFDDPETLMVSAPAVPAAAVDGEATGAKVEAKPAEIQDAASAKEVELPAATADAKAEISSESKAAKAWDMTKPIEGAWLMVHPAQRTVGLCVGREYVKVYRGVGMPQDAARDKLEAEDGKTPKGRYFVGMRMDDDTGPRMILSWPAPQDAERAMSAGGLDKAAFEQIVAARKAKAMPPQDTPLGGGLALVSHGEEPVVTLGDIAFREADIRELYTVLPENAWVVIE